LLVIREQILTIYIALRERMVFVNSVHYSGGSQRSYRSIPAFRKPFLHPDIAKKKMENQSQWGKICTGDFHHPQKDVATLNGLRILQAEDARYLGLHLDRRLNWRKHIFTKRKQLGIQLSKMYWLLGSKSQLSIESKLLLYKAILKPIWTYVQL